MVSAACLACESPVTERADVGCAHDLCSDCVHSWNERLAAADKLEDVEHGRNGAATLLCPICCAGGGTSPELCPICLDIIVAPRASNCGHRFCSVCADAWTEQTGATRPRALTARCPICRQLTELTNSDRFFYPSRMSLARVRVCGVETVACHDLGAAHHDIRHVVDRAFLQALPHGDRLLARLVEPKPPCARVGGIDDCPVLGMLHVPLALELFALVEQPPRAHSVRLSCVLVAQVLPVPLFVSAKGSAISSLACVEDALNMCQGCIRFGPSNVPEAYRAHPYWSPDRPPMVGSAATSGMAEVRTATELMEREMGRATGAAPPTGRRRPAEVVGAGAGAGGAGAGGAGRNTPPPKRTVVANDDMIGIRRLAMGGSAGSRVIGPIIAIWLIIADILVADSLHKLWHQKSLII